MALLTQIIIIINDKTIKTANVIFLELLIIIMKKSPEKTNGLKLKKGEIQSFKIRST